MPRPVRGRRVMIDNDLAALYGVKTKYINQQVNRNIERFPETFMFRLTPADKNELVANCNRFENLKHSSVMPRAFTEHGVAMLASFPRAPRPGFGG
ncbi:MAG: ORF6N domain-containing protein [Elusimicrobia bacterium]|nr:ORF6N domain-containing protein [Elusimicrobiota bacterium]